MDEYDKQMYATAKNVVSYDISNCWENHAEFNSLAIQGQWVFSLALNTGIACSTHFQLLLERYKPLNVSSLCLLLLPHYTIHRYTHECKRLGGWEDGYGPEWQPYHWVFSLQGQWALVPGNASFFSSYLCMSVYTNHIEQKMSKVGFRKMAHWLFEKYHCYEFL